MVGHGGSSAGSYLADPTSPIPSHCASIVATSTVRVKSQARSPFIRQRQWQCLLQNQFGDLFSASASKYTVQFYAFHHCRYCCRIRGLQRLIMILESQYVRPNNSIYFSQLAKIRVGGNLNFIWQDFFCGGGGRHISFIRLSDSKDKDDKSPNERTQHFQHIHEMKGHI